MTHIVLLGDSIFDNKAYVGNEADVAAHLREMIPQDWKATLKAIDGSVVENVARQLQELPVDATHLFISAGGNDAPMNADVLSLRANSAAEVFNALSDRTSEFERRYSEMLEAVSSLNLPAAVCTVYYPNFPDAFMQKTAVAALAAFNDVIIRQAAAAGGLPVLDLRLVCSDRGDYANEIEPSGRGGRKIASKIFEVVKNHDFSKKITGIYF
jgi:hypothetical protein